MNRRILKGTVVALALFALVPATNAAAKGDPGHRAKATLHAKALGKQYRLRLQYGNGNPEIPINRPAFGWRP